MEVLVEMKIFASGHGREREETVERSSWAEVKAISPSGVQTRVIDWLLLQGLTME